jgi:DNA repair protein RecO (recombination protein O)
VFLHKKSDALDLLTEAKLERRFKSAGRALQRFYAAMYVAELLAAMTDEADPHPEVFDLADAVLSAIDGDSDVPGQVCRFEIGAMTLLGHQPMLHKCVECGRDKTCSTARVNFGLLAGGVYCGRCRQGKTNVVNLSAEAWESLVELVQMATAELPETSAVRRPMAADHLSELRPFLNQYLACHLGYRPRLQKYLTGPN